MWIDRVQRAGAEFENLNGGLGPAAAAAALDPKPCSVAHWTHSIRIQQNGAWKGIVGVIIRMLVSEPQTRQWRL